MGHLFLTIWRGLSKNFGLDLLCCMLFAWFVPTEREIIPQIKLDVSFFECLYSVTNTLGQYHFCDPYAFVINSQEKFIQCFPVPVLLTFTMLYPTRN